MQHEILIEYFRAIQNSYSVEWDNKAFFLCKYVGVSSLLSLLEKIIADLRGKGIIISDGKGLRIGRNDFTPYVARLRRFSFSTAEEKKEGISYVGESGITELTKRIVGLVFGEAHADGN